MLAAMFGNKAAPNMRFAAVCQWPRGRKQGCPHPYRQFVDILGEIQPDSLPLRLPDAPGSSYPFTVAPYLQRLP